MRVGGPQAEGALAVLPSAQHLDQILQRLVIFRFHVAELGPVAEYQRGQAHAHQLLGAGILEALQIRRQTVRQYQRHVRDARLQLAVVWVKRARYRCISGAVAHRACDEMRDIRLRRAHADTGTQFRALVHAAGREGKRTGAEFILDAHLEAGDAFAQFAHFECVARSPHHLKMRRHGQRHRHLRIGAGAGYIVGHAHTDVELVTRRHRQRRIGRQHKVAA